MTDFRKIAVEIFLAGVAGVRADKLIRAQIHHIENTGLAIGNLKFDLQSVRNIYVIGAGKASAALASEVEAILGSRITEGHVVVKYGHGRPLKHIRLTEAGHPVPDANGIKGTAEIVHIAKKAAKDDLVLCLLSGGGSALMADYPDGAELADIIKLNQLLVDCGADIAEINTVRKHLSRVKGGQLARKAQPARVVTLVLSDVAGDALDVIASGPTAPDTSSFRDALNVINKFSLASDMPSALLNHLKNGVEGRIPETPDTDDPIFENTHNVIIGNNPMALQAGLRKAVELRFETRIADVILQGDAALMARAIVDYAGTVRSNPATKNNVCLLFGGETTVKVSGPGLGGRNQHLALAAAIELADKPGITLLSAGTDGTDGPTDATGAVVDCQTIARARAKGIDPHRHLKEFDGYHFFKEAGGHIITGPTMTNVMDMVVVTVEKNN